MFITPINYTVRHINFFSQCGAYDKYVVALKGSYIVDDIFNVVASLLSDGTVGCRFRIVNVVFRVPKSEGGSPNNFSLFDIAKTIS